MHLTYQQQTATDFRAGVGENQQIIGHSSRAHKYNCKLILMLMNAMNEC